MKKALFSFSAPFLALRRAEGTIPTNRCLNRPCFRKHWFLLLIRCCLIILIPILTFILYGHITQADSSPLFGANVRVSDEAGRAVQGPPAIAVDAANNIHVVWRDERTLLTGDDIYYAKSTDGGSSFAPNVKVNEDVATSHMRPSIAVDENGTIYVAWQELRGYTWYVYFAKSTDGGDSFGSYKQVSSGAQPSIVADSSGIIYIAWQNWDIYFAKSTDSGESFGPAVRVSSETATNYPSIDVDESGNIYIAWTGVLGGNSDIYFAKSSDGGLSFGSPMTVNDVSGTAGRPSLAVSNEGDIFIAWQDDRNESQGDQGDIYFAKSTDGGISFGVSTKVNDDVGTDYQGCPAIAVDGRGNVYVAWDDRRRSNHDIYYAGLGVHSNAWFANVRVNDDVGALAQQYPALTADGVGSVYAAWWDVRDGYSIYFARMTEFFRWPLNNPVPRKFYSFGSVYADTSRYCPGKLHQGVDDHEAHGANVHAIADGTVFVKGEDSGYGKYVVIEHQVPQTGETVYSLYAHLDSNSEAPAVGQSVDKGDVIGKEGQTGTDKVHLHFEIRKPSAVTADAVKSVDCQSTRAELEEFFYDPDWFIEKYRYLEGGGDSTEITERIHTQTRYDTDTIDPGESSSLITYIVNKVLSLFSFVLNWGGSTLEITVYRPDESAYVTESGTAPIVITIPDPEIGTWTYTVTGVDVPHDDYPYQVSIGETEGPTDPVDENYSEADLSLGKSVTPTVAVPGQAITYTLVYTNSGPNLATSVLITDVVPISVTNVSYTSSGATITPTGSVSYTWQVEDLASGEGGVITITGVLSTGLPAGPFTNTATITTTTVDTDASNNSGSARLDTLCDTVTEIPKVECEALVALYNSTDGANWSNNSGWMETNTPCGWYGVTCSASHVTRLDLSDNQLTGSIPPELGNLANLQYLSLSFNQLSDSIPPELGDLTNLQDLSLDYNQLSGGIPTALGNLASLQKLSLSDNQLSGSIPAELGSLTNLQHLYLYGNQLSGSIPPELGNLANLQDLYLRWNQLSGSVPPELGNLTNLQYLGLSGNQLSGGIPAELGSLANLQYLSLSGNQLTGSIPTELGNLANLQELYLSSNQLSGSIPPELGNLARLQSLWLYNNQLSGSIPPELGNLTNLQYLRLSDNQLTSSIPPELGNLANLTSLILSNNQLSGSIPAELGSLTNLYLLHLNGNQLTLRFPNRAESGSWSHSAAGHFSV